MSKIEDYLKNKNIWGVKSSNAFLVQILEEMDQIQFYYPWNLIMSKHKGRQFVQKVSSL